MKQIVVACMLLLCCSALRAQQYQALRLSDPHPAAGQQLWISYDPSNTVLQEEKKPACRVFYYDKDKKNAEVRLDFQPSGKGWKSALTIPANAVMLHILPITADGKERDNNKEAGYLFPVYKAGVPLSFAYYRMSVLAGGIPLDEGRLKKDPVRELALMKAELRYHPANEAVLKDQFYNQLINSSEASDKQLLISKLSLLKSDQEPELMMTQMYLSYLGVKSKADSLDRLLRNKFPAGRYVFEKGIEQIKNENNPEQKLLLANHFLKQFPENLKAVPQDFQRIALYEHLAEAMQSAGNEEGVSKYLLLIRDANNRAAFYNKTALQYLKKKAFDEALKYGRKAVLEADTTGQRGYWDPYISMANIFYDQKAYQEGLEYAAKGYRHLKNKETTTTYVKLLMATNQFQEAQSVLENTIRKGEASVQMKTALKTLYDTRSTGNEQPFESYLAGLQQPADKNFSKHLNDQIILEKVKPIALKDLNGKTVELATLNGKIVVLDFWATWCKPCIQSFPAMQKVMEKYPQVVFLYIATFEKGDANALVKQFKKDNASYPFSYLIDEQLNGSSFKAYDNYKASGVPYKVILDQKGNIRFRSAGFSGNDDGLINELSAVIEYLTAATEQGK